MAEFYMMHSVRNISLLYQTLFYTNNTGDSQHIPNEEHNLLQERLLERWVQIEWMNNCMCVGDSAQM